MFRTLRTTDQIVFDRYYGYCQKADIRIAILAEDYFDFGAALGIHVGTAVGLDVETTLHFDVGTALGLGLGTELGIPSAAPKSKQSSANIAIPISAL